MSNLHAVYQEQGRKHVEFDAASSKVPSYPICHDEAARKKSRSEPSDSDERYSNAISSETQQPTVKSLFASSSPLTPGNKRHEAITDAITYFLCKDNVPFNAVQVFKNCCLC